MGGRAFSILSPHLDDDIMTALLLLACLGISSVAGRSSKIINGHDTDIHHHPHQVSLTNRGSHSCGGSVIGDFHVLTAAHCVQGAMSNYAIQTNNGNRFQDVTTYQVVRLTNHPNYNQGQGAYPNDVAVLEVSGRITDSLPQQHINMATSSSGDFARQHCTITGWGRNEGGVLPAQLQETNGEILSSTGCSNYWGNNYNHNAHICIDNQNSGACNGDSGGPMVCGNTLVGVTSWGVSGCATNYPSVYARVSSYNSWIVGAM